MNAAMNDSLRAALRYIEKQWACQLHVSASGDMVTVKKRGVSRDVRVDWCFAEETVTRLADARDVCDREADMREQAALP